MRWVRVGLPVPIALSTACLDASQQKYKLSLVLELLVIASVTVTLEQRQEQPNQVQERPNALTSSSNFTIEEVPSNTSEEVLHIQDYAQSDNNQRYWDYVYAAGISLFF